MYIKIYVHSDEYFKLKINEDINEEFIGIYPKRIYFNSYRSLNAK